MDKKKEYITKLLAVIDNLHSKVSTAEQEDTLSFSFFKDSFNKSQEIMSLIHDLEMFHIEDMKRQMERLIVFLSENESKKQSIEEPIEPTIQTKIEGNQEQIIERDEKEESPIPPPAPIPPIQKKSSESFVLPTYVNPNINRAKDEKKEEIKNAEPAVNNINTLSINDVVKVPQAKIDVKRGLSLNDRFFFQRELFNNDREAMNSMMIKLNAFDIYEEVEEYLKENTSWNFDDEKVKSFLEVLSKGIN